MTIGKAQFLFFSSRPFFVFPSWLGRTCDAGVEMGTRRWHLAPCRRWWRGSGGGGSVGDAGHLAVSVGRRDEARWPVATKEAARQHTPSPLPGRASWCGGKPAATGASARAAQGKRDGAVLWWWWRLRPVAMAGSGGSGGGGGIWWWRRGCGELKVHSRWSGEGGGEGGWAVRAAAGHCGGGCLWGRK